MMIGEKGANLILADAREEQQHFASQEIVNAAG
jgi:hypothetical protein